MADLFYNDTVPDFVREICETPPMQRLKNVGMNCGCEYTSFERFRFIGSYSRFEHSLGAGLIVLHFTKSKQQTAAALLHDIATPVFAHTVDFLNGDHIRQESTESGTESIICSSPELCRCLEKYGIPVDDVTDYHRYPIADNDSPRLSSDRLEYTLGNAVRYRICSRNEAEGLYKSISAGTNEDGAEELMFESTDAALRFGKIALVCSKIYVSDEDRYSMQVLSELLGLAIGRNVISRRELYTTEPHVISKIKSDTVLCSRWDSFRRLHRMIPPPENAAGRVIRAKKRHIDPIIAGKGRLSSVSPEFFDSLKEFLSEPQDEVLYAE